MGGSTTAPNRAMTGPEATTVAARAPGRAARDAGSATLHMVGNTHIDPVWLWPWQEGFGEVRSTFRAVLDLMRDDEELLFTTGSAAFHQWIEESDPEMFEEIRGRVAEGRWCIAGGWWVEPDCNIPSGESYARHALYSQRYFHSRLGVTATVGYNVDSFGHNAMLPQLLRKSGINAYVFQRPEPNEKDLPASIFWWQAPDGSRVLAQRIPFGYGSSPDELDAHVARCAAEIGEQFRELMCFYGVGNHGGGPTRRNLESIRRLNDDPQLPRLVQSTPNRFFAAAFRSGVEFPVVRDELQHHARGCYAAHSGVKRWNREAENALLCAERFSALAQRLAGQPYPDAFEMAWKGVLFNQFHDVLAGTAIEPAYEDARDTYGEALAVAARSANFALQAIARRIDIPRGDGVTAIVVFNPHAWWSRAPIELETRALEQMDRLFDDEDHAIPMQAVPAFGAASGRSRLCFAAELPPMGYRVYRLRRGGRREGQPRVGWAAPPWPADRDDRDLRASNDSLENEQLRLAIDRDGRVSLFDKRLGRELLAGGASARVIDDPSDTWGHGRDRWDDEVGTFTTRSIKLVERGPVRAALRVRSGFGGSSLVQDFTLYRGLDRVEVKVALDWHERHRLIKLRFPVAVTSGTATFEIPFGHLVRHADGTEVPGQGWVDVTGAVPGAAGAGTAGLSVINDAKYSYDVRGSEIGLTVVRSPIYAHHQPFVPQPDGDYTYQDQGVQRFTYALLPHSGSWRDAGTVRRTLELNQRPMAMIESQHRGDRPQAATLVEAVPDNVVITALKKAEDGDGIVVRAYETAGREAHATLRLAAWDREIRARFGPCEIKTFKLGPGEDAKTVETNLLEWPADGEGPAR